MEGKGDYKVEEGGKHRETEGGKRVVGDKRRVYKECVYIHTDIMRPRFSTSEMSGTTDRDPWVH